LPLGLGPWVTIHQYGDPVVAEISRIRLEAEGIPTFLEGERMGGYGVYQLATGGMKLQVPRHLRDEARIILSQSWTPPSLPDHDVDDAWEELEPEPGHLRRRIMRVFIVLMLGWPAIHLIAWFLGPR